MDVPRERARVGKRERARKHRIFRFGYVYVHEHVHVVEREVLPPSPKPHRW